MRKFWVFYKLKVQNIASKNATKPPEILGFYGIKVRIIARKSESKPRDNFGFISFNFLFKNKVSL